MRSVSQTKEKGFKSPANLQPNDYCGSGMTARNRSRGRSKSQRRKALQGANDDTGYESFKGGLESKKRSKSRRGRSASRSIKKKAGRSKSRSTSRKTRLDRSTSKGRKRS